MHDHGHFWRRYGKPILGTLHLLALPLSTTRQAFAYRRFLGDYRAQREVGALALAELRPTVPEHEVYVHTHDDAHFLLLLQGNYLNSVRSMPEALLKATALNPPYGRERPPDGRRSLALLSSQLF